MSKTAFTTSNALTKKAWDEELYRDMVKESFFMGGGFSGNSSNNIVHVKTQLEKGKGDKITFGIRMRLSGTGVTSGSILQGNEEALSTYDASVSLEQYRHAVRDAGALDRKRAMFSIDEEARSALKDWGAEKIDSLCFTALFASPTKIAYRDGSAGAFTVGTVVATVKTALSATYKINVAFIAALATYAKTGGNRAFVPLRPIKYKGKDYYVLLVHPDVAYDLKQDTILQASWQNAVERGDDNPLFRDAICMWDGVIVKTHENCTIASDAGAGANVAWAKGALLGAQALVWAWGERPEVVQETFDYGNEHGYAWGFIGATTKPVFNSLDYGSIGVYLPRTAISGA